MTPNDIRNEINVKLQELVNTDYQSLKHSEGAMTDEEFAPIAEARAACRARINELQAMLPEDE